MESDAQPPSRARARPRALLVLAGLSLLWAAAVWAGGGLDATIAGLHVRSHDPVRPALLALALAALYVATGWRQAAGDLGRLGEFVGSHANLFAAGLSIAVGAAAWSQTSMVASGADPYGYVSQAYLWLDGHLTVPQPFAREVPWPFADLTFTPLGYRPALGGGAIVPTYAPGLPMLMALGARVAGDCGPFAIVPLLGAFAIWLTYRLGLRMWSAWHGLAAALLLAVSPAFTHMLMWPMSDVPVATWWLAATVSALSGGRWSSLRTGLCISVAILIRPNLAPLGLPFALWVFGGEDSRAERLGRVAWLAAGALPGVAIVAAVNLALYGAPWRSGYGDLDSLYAWGHLARNLSRYPRWLVETQTPAMLAMLVPVATSLRWGGRADSRVLLLGALVAGTWASYLFYVPFDDWWYLRFLLPAFPAMLVLSVEGWRRLASRWRPGLRIAAVALVTLACAAHGAARIAAERLSDIGDGELAYVRVAQFVADRLPPNALLLAMQHSGSLRYYAGRPTLRYDWLAPEWWPRALDVLEQRGLRPFIVVSDWEEPLVRERFGPASAGSDPLGCLVATEDRPHGFRIYDPLRGPWCGPVRIAPAVTRPCRRPVAMTVPGHTAVR